MSKDLGVATRKESAREMTSEPDGIMPDQRKPGVLAARLLIGLIVGLRLHSPREPLPVNVVDVEPRELRLAMAVFAWVIGLGFVFSFVARQPLIFIPFVPNSVVWTFLGFLLTAIAFWQGVREFRNPRAGSHGLDKENRGFRELQLATEKNALDDPNPCVP